MSQKQKPQTKPIKVTDASTMKVLVGTIFIDAKGKERVQCLMSDNSIWVCDPNGTNWHPAVLPIEELTNRFLTEMSRMLVDSRA